MTLEDPRKALRKLEGEKDKDVDPGLSPTTTIELDFVGTRGKHYKHAFTYTVPTLGQQVKIGQLKSQFLPSGAMADPNANLLVEQICYLTVTLNAKNLPDWWDPWNMYDGGPIGTLYGEALIYEHKFHGRDPQHSHDQSGEEMAQGSGQNGPASAETSDADMGGEVPAPSKRRKTIVATSG